MGPPGEMNRLDENSKNLYLRGETGRYNGSKGIWELGTGVILGEC